MENFMNFTNAADGKEKNTKNHRTSLALSFILRL